MNFYDQKIPTKVVPWAKTLQIKRQFISDKIIIGIDPAKKKHQAVFVNNYGLPITNSFTFASSKQGYAKLLKKVKQQIEKSNEKNIILVPINRENLLQSLVYLKLFSKIIRL